MEGELLLALWEKLFPQWFLLNSIILVLKNTQISIHKFLFALNILNLCSYEKRKKKNFSVLYFGTCDFWKKKYIYMQCYMYVLRLKAAARKVQNQYISFVL